MIVLSYVEAREILKGLILNPQNSTSDSDNAYSHNRFKVKINLGLSDGIIVPRKDKIIIKVGDEEEHLKIKDLKMISQEERFCFLIKDEKALRIAFFSEKTRKYYKLLPTGEAPTIEISGIRMHQVKNLKPMMDTKLKVNLLRPKGVVLDTCTGLGYTAITITKKRKVKKVITVEKDENILNIASYNPWSWELFNNEKIELVSGDIMNVVKKFKRNSFDSILHDPPSFKIAGELYSIKLYEEFYRILRPKGRLFHYVGRPGHKSGKHIVENVRKRLIKAGFRVIKKSEEAMGFLAVKEV